MTLKSEWQYHITPDPDAAFTEAMTKAKSAHDLGLSFSLGIKQITTVGAGNSLYYVVKVGTRRVR